jgi:starch synthase
MHIVFAASECVPYVKTGGLADVVGALPPQLVKLGHRVTVYLPFYRPIQKRFPEPRYVIPSITIPFEYYNRFVGVVDGGLVEGVQFYFLDCPELFDREGLYSSPQGDYWDNWERFALYSRAVLEASKQLGVPDVFHAHDWQAAMVVVYLRTLYYFDPVLRRAASVITIHNAAYQGAFPPQTTERLLFPWDIFTKDKVEHYDTFNFLKGSLVYSDVITTVSRKYAEEIQTKEFGETLEGVLQNRAHDLYGILNGVDYGKWNPATDPHIAAHYTANKMAGKQKCRQDLLHAFGLEHITAATPVLGIVSRFATQKGFDLLAQIAPELAQRDIALVALGTGEGYYEDFFRVFAKSYPKKVAVKIGYDDTLAHKIEAGSDIFLMPSRYEPCGLNQIYSLKYGTVPVVRATGGLDDTIEEWNQKTGVGTGFKFDSLLPQDFLSAIDRALGAYRKAIWPQIIRNGMRKNYDWSAPAKEYAEVYKLVVQRRS